MNKHKLAFSFIGIFIVQLSYAGYFKHIGREEGLSQSSVMAIYQDKLGRMWFGTREGVNIYNSDRMTVYICRAFIFASTMAGIMEEMGHTVDRTALLCEIGRASCRERV